MILNNNNQGAFLELLQKKVTAPLCHSPPFAVLLFSPQKHNKCFPISKCLQQQKIGKVHALPNCVADNKTIPTSEF